MKIRLDTRRSPPPSLWRTLSPRPPRSPIRSRPRAGKLSGVTLPSGVRAFKGIPFGAPPVGDLRWKEPQPVAKWDGVRKADQFGNVCVQPLAADPRAEQRHRRSARLAEDQRGLPVSERVDAANRADDRQPVMVWIFGGAYTEGGGSSQHNDGESLAKKGVVARHVQLPPRTVRLLRASGAHEGVGPERVGQPGAGRQHRRAAVGEDEHRGVRRRPEQRDDLRRVRRRRDGWRAGRIAGRQRPVPSRDQPRAAHGWGSAWDR